MLQGSRVLLLFGRFLFCFIVLLLRGSLSQGSRFIYWRFVVLAEDPEERRDLSAQMPRKVAEMSARMDQYLAEAKSLDLAHQEADLAAWGFGGVWLPGWCDASIFG